MIKSAARFLHGTEVWKTGDFVGVVESETAGTRFLPMAKKGNCIALPMKSAAGAFIQS